MTGGGLYYRNSAGFTVGSVTVSPPSLGGALSGVTTSGSSEADHAVALIAGNGGLTTLANTLTLDANVDTTGAGSVKSDVALETLAGANPGGNVVEPEPPAAGGYVVAANLLVRSAGTIDLEQKNLVDALAANAAGGIAFNDNQILTVSASMTVTAPSATIRTLSAQPCVVKADWNHSVIHRPVAGVPVASVPWPT